MLNAKSDLLGHISFTWLIAHSMKAQISKVAPEIDCGLALFFFEVIMFKGRYCLVSHSVSFPVLPLRKKKRHEITVHFLMCH